VSESVSGTCMCPDACTGMECFQEPTSGNGDRDDGHSHCIGRRGLDFVWIDVQEIEKEGRND